MWLNQKLLASLVAGICMLASAYLHSAVAWVFIETTCTAPNVFPSHCPQNLNEHLPEAVAFLDVGINSSGTYHFSGLNSSNFEEQQTGDPFIFEWLGLPNATAPVSEHCDVCGWDIAFTSSSLTGLSISIHYFLDFFSDTIDLSGTNELTEGSIGSDGLMEGCGFFLLCNVTGFWNLSGVVDIPEPSSLAVLASGLVSIFILLTVKFIRRFGPSHRLAS